jgi:hypothetical protein
MTFKTSILHVAAGVGLAMVTLWALLSVSLIALKLPDESGDSQAIAEVDRDSWDFGKCPPGASLQAVFSVHNRGTQRLILHKLNGDCDCVSSADPEVIVEPGAVVVLKPRLDSSHASGRLRVETSYSTNDVRKPLLRLIMTAEIRES